MATNLFSELAREFGGDTVNKVAGALGEDAVRTKAALDGTLQAMVGGLMNKASTREGAADLLDFLKRNDFDGARTGNIASTLSAPDGISRLVDAGTPLLNSIFGGRTNSVIDWVTSLGGIRRSSASSLFALAVPLVLGHIGKLVSGAGWNVSNLMGLLGDQRNFLNLPAGLTNALGFGTTEYTSERRAPAAYVKEPAQQGSTWWKWALPLLALLAVGFLLSRLFSGREEQAQSNIAVPTATVRVEVSPTLVPAPVRAELGAFIDKRLPNGTVIRIPTNGVESKLIAFIEDPTQMVNKITWFSFDRLEFDTDSATLKPSSGEQLRNMSEILKGYPNVDVKIGGYTDNVGADAYNMKLSAERAKNTEMEIEKLGIADARLDSEGYGKQHPVADNATEEGRQRNRRIDIRVMKK